MYLALQHILVRFLFVQLPLKPILNNKTISSQICNLIVCGGGWEVCLHSFNNDSISV